MQWILSVSVLAREVGVGLSWVLYQQGTLGKYQYKAGRIRAVQGTE